MKITIRQPLTFSEIGRKDNQEDRVYPNGQEVNTDSLVFLLCDGMGGHEKGEVASETVSQALGECLEKMLKEDRTVTTESFNEALNYAYDELDKKDTGAFKKMGTTMTCLCLHREGYLVAHIGDSRIYHIRPSLTDKEKGRLGIIYQSADHSLVNELICAGRLTAEEAANFPRKNVILRAMQPNLEERFKADVYSFVDIQAGDYFFLCSDGILEQLTNEQLSKILSDPSMNDKEKLAAIKAICDENTRDNYTCYLIPIETVVPEEGDREQIDSNVIQGVVPEMEEQEEEESTDTIQQQQTILPICQEPEVESEVDEIVPVEREPHRKTFFTSRRMLWMFVCLILLAIGIGAMMLKQTPHVPVGVDKEQATESENSLPASDDVVPVVGKDVGDSIDNPLSDAP